MDVREAIAAQPHVQAVLRGGLPPDGSPSHAYLFHGPSGSGKRTVARAVAVALLSDGVAAPDGAASVAARVERGAHPDLTWVRPTGAGEMRVSDVDEAVVEAIARRPFEAHRSVFVLERADLMNERAANRLLKTLEEPPDYACLVLLSDRPGDLLPTIRSRCQPVRFDARSEDEQTASIVAAVGVGEVTARACARLALGDVALARALAGEEGTRLRGAAEAVARHVVWAAPGPAPVRAMTVAAAARGEAAAERTQAEASERAEDLPARERRRATREAKDDAKRAARRERTAVLDLGLRLVGLWLRDLCAVAGGGAEHVHNLDRTTALGEDAARLSGTGVALRGVEQVDRTRRALRRNATEDLQLDALAVRLTAVLAGRR